MRQSLVALLGISGAGKTTFLRQLAKDLQFQHLTAGTLIASARKAGIPRDELRLQDLEENQQLLLRGLFLTKDHSIPLVILDGHAIIDGPDGPVSVEAKVFRDVGAKAVVHFEAQPTQIYANRKSDLSRNRPQLAEPEIARHQALSLSAAERIATDLAVPFRRFTSADHEAFCSFTLSLVDSD